MSSLFMPKDQKSLSDLINPKVVPKKGKSGNALIVSLGKEVFALEYFDDEPVKIGEYKDDIHGGAIYNGKLHLASDMGIFNWSDGEYHFLVHSKDLVRHDNDVYYFSDTNKIFSMDKGELDFRSKPIRGFCVHEGDLYDCGDYGVVGSSGVVMSHNPARSICSHGGKLYALDEGKGYVDVFYGERLLTYANLSCSCAFDELMVFGYGDWILDYFGNGQAEFGKDVHALFTVPKVYLGGLL